MSKYNNVNPDHYKVAGRERPGNAVAKAPKASASGDRQALRWERQEETRQRNRPAASRAPAGGRAK